MRKKACIDSAKLPLCGRRVHRAHRELGLKALLHELHVRFTDDGEGKENEHGEGDTDHDDDGLFRRLQTEEPIGKLRRSHRVVCNILIETNDNPADEDAHK